ncbi:MAG: hypothetical protein NUV52_00525 [Candidatus Roizmanbacteria bacterium]|nr:hypothetical protein [Candidatus Roizmanbacteria bacterium]
MYYPKLKYILLFFGLAILLFFILGGTNFWLKQGYGIQTSGGLPRRTEPDSFAPSISPDDVLVGLLYQLTQSTTCIKWQNIQRDSWVNHENIRLAGYSRMGTAELTSLCSPDNEDALARLDWREDANLGASGPGGMTWGYKKQKGTHQQLLIFTKKTSSCSLGDNGQCDHYQVNVFLSDELTIE